MALRRRSISATIARGGVGVQAAHGRGVDLGEVRQRAAARSRRGRVHGGDLHDVRAHAHAERAQERLAERAAGDARGGLARGGPLEDVAHVAVLVLLGADEIGVTGARQVDLGDVLVDRPRVHALLPVGVVAVGDLQRDGTAERAPVAHAGRDLGAVALDLHAPAAAVAELAARHVGVERPRASARGPAGRPSTMQVRPGPWDSPAVIRRSAMAASLFAIALARGAVVVTRCRASAYDAGGAGHRSARRELADGVALREER